MTLEQKIGVTETFFGPVTRAGAGDAGEGPLSASGCGSPASGIRRDYPNRLLLRGSEKDQVPKSRRTHGETRDRRYEIQQSQFENRSDPGFQF
jgi:hypothetical protein